MILTIVLAIIAVISFYLMTTNLVSFIAQYALTDLSIKNGTKYTKISVNLTMTVYASTVLFTSIWECPKRPVP